MIVKITSTAICGSDLHLYDGYMPTMEDGDILGHEPMGEVVEVGSAITKFRIGDRIVVPFHALRAAPASSARRNFIPAATRLIAMRRRPRK